MKFILAFVCFLVVITVIHGLSDDDAWRLFKRKYNKNYNIAADGGQQDRIQKEAFLQRRKHILDFNTIQHNYRKGVTRFCDMLPGQFKERLGFHPPPAQLKQTTVKPDDVSSDDENAEDEARKLRQSSPYKFDHRYDPCMPNIKIQAKCASSWAFSAITPIEFAYCKANNISVLFSEQQLLDCDVDGNSKGCNGGVPMSAFDYISRNGLARALQYPYKALVGPCKYDESMKAVGLKLNNYLEPKNIVDMKYALITFGPLSAAITATQSLGDYVDGVYDDADCDGQPANHAVVLVGWGNKNGVDHWIVRNSWGTDWGKRGYFFIQSGVNKCGIENLVAYIKIEEPV